MYDITMAIVGSGIILGIHWLVEKRKQNSVSNEEAG
jgi:hypothetical protein